MRACCVVLPLVPLAVGDVVERAAWPAHVTLVGNAHLADGATDTAAAVLHGFAAAIAPLTGVVDGEGRFGPDASVVVDLLGSPALLVAHRDLLDALERHVEGFALDEPHHARDGYRPHRTVTPGSRPALGSTVRLLEALLVELEPEDLADQALVLARWPLGGPTGGTAVGEADVHAVLDALVDVPAWVIGGWGVDALAGRQTRAHHDLDLFVDGDGTEQAICALARLGFAVRFVWSENRWSGSGRRLVPSAFVAVDAAGREVDVHTVSVREGRVTSRSASTVELPMGALDATGSIGGRHVSCATAEAQLVMHTGYPLPDRQRGDLALLRALAG